ncbi:hypothetical protein [Endozoicomonas arenosclerae]|uniref:hypothetical protein n=1 Tax=Endozoicomonas arenosclerae TaxID=1633495 RepID=UPI000A722836|nr:hypothetical protein [Endozoicomonas arenosclerae]
MNQKVLASGYFLFSMLLLVIQPMAIAKPLAQHSPAENGQKVVVMIEQTRYYEIKSSIDIYQTDLEKEGWTVHLELQQGSTFATAEEFHIQIDSLYEKEKMQALVLVGRFPFYYFSTPDLMLSSDIKKKSIIYTSRFWISRIDPSMAPYLKELQIDKDSYENHLLRNYFSRNHLYRSYKKTCKSPEICSRIRYIQSLAGHMQKLEKEAASLITAGEAVSVDTLTDFMNRLSQKDYFTAFHVFGTGHPLNAEGDFDMGIKPDPAFLMKKSKANHQLLVLSSAASGRLNTESSGAALLFAPYSRTLAVIAPQNDIPYYAYLRSTVPDKASKTVGDAYRRSSLLSTYLCESHTLFKKVIDLGKPEQLNDVGWLSVKLFDFLCLVVNEDRDTIGTYPLTLFGDGTLRLPPRQPSHPKPQQSPAESLGFYSEDISEFTLDEAL